MLRGMIDLKHRIIFIHIPKTGGTAVERYFLSLRGLGWPDRGALGIFRNPTGSRLARGHQHCTLAQVERLVFGGRIPDDFRIFATVRHPEARFISEWASRRLPPARLSPVQFRLPARLLMRLAERPSAALPDLASHLVPQSDYLDGAEAAGRVRLLRHERLAADFAELREDWGLPRLELRRENASPPRRLSERGLAGMREFVGRFYRADYERFSYDIDPAGQPARG